MLITALSTIIHWDNGQMVILNPGETGELSDALALEEIAAGYATATVDAAPSAPAGTPAGDPASIEALRARYIELIGKKPFLGWKEPELTKKISEAEAELAAQASAPASIAPPADTAEIPPDAATVDQTGADDDLPPA